MKIYHPTLIPPIKGGKVPSPLVGEGQGEGYFRANTINAAEIRPSFHRIFHSKQSYQDQIVVSVADLQQDSLLEVML